MAASVILWRWPAPSPQRWNVNYPSYTRSSYTRTSPEYTPGSRTCRQIGGSARKIEKQAVSLTALSRGVREERPSG